MKENQLQEQTDLSFSSEDLAALENMLGQQLQDSLSELDFLKEEREKINNPDELGTVIINEVWTQFGNQIGLDLTKETLIQEYDRKHPNESYSTEKDRVMKDSAYKEATNAMKEEHQKGVLTDSYTGKKLKLGQDKPNLDHVIARKRVYENQRRKQAGLSTADVANLPENLRATNESLNKSKKEKSPIEYGKYIKENEDTILANAERQKKKVDKDTSLNSLDKREKKEKIDKRTKDKLAADSELLGQSEREAKQAIGKKITKGVIGNTAKKAGKDALKAIAVSALMDLLKNVMVNFIVFLKSKQKSMSAFLRHLKQAIHRFLKNMLSHIKAGVTTALGTIVSEVFGPIASLFTKLTSLIKQMVSTVSEAISYLANPQNKSKPFSIKIAEIGKIVVAGLVAGGAIFGGEVFEKILLTIPGMNISIPSLGTLANLIGMFLASLISGLIGAMLIQMLNRFISNKLYEDSNRKIREKTGEILGIQQLQLAVAGERVRVWKTESVSTMYQHNQFAGDYIEEVLANNRKEEKKRSDRIEIKVSDHRDEFDQLQEELSKLL